MSQILIADARHDPPTLVGGWISGSWYRLVVVESEEEAITAAVASDGLLAAVVADDLPGTPFAELERRLHGVLPGLPLIALTSDSSVNSVVNLMRAGAADVLVRPLREVSLVTSVSRLFMQPRAIPADGLAARECQVFSLLGEGCSTSDIAARLRLSIKTVDGTLIRLRNKMHCDEVASLRRLAVARSRQIAVQEAITAVVPVMGHEVIDAGHNGMLTQLCRLECALGDDDRATLVAAADALLTCAHEHDQAEVGLMRSSDFPGIIGHQAEHAILLDEILALKSRVTQGRAASIEAFRTFVLHWLGQHVQRFDRALVAHVRKRFPERATDGRRD